MAVFIPKPTIAARPSLRRIGLLCALPLLALLALALGGGAELLRWGVAGT
ncbi:MAG: hypothetical protein H7Y32_01730, partial [Chloroflexales bacterium]|nr:hypothetical protein [Chloroflexales bacterium]